MKHLRLLAAAAGLLWLAGCALPRPPANVDPQAPDQWHAPLPHGGTLADLKLWWQQFDDSLLVELVDAAQAASPTVGSAASRIVQARAARVGATANLLPAVDANGSAVRSNTSGGVPLTATTTQVGLQASWEIDLFGGNRAFADAAQARYEGTQAGWHDARVAIAAETANAYIGYRTCERVLTVVRSDAQSRAETARLTELSAQAGFTAPAVAAQARASAADGSQRAIQQQGQCDVEIKGLVALTGMDERVLRRKLGAPWTAVPDVAPLTLPSVPAALLAQRPDVFQAEREVAAASAEVGTARADRFPRLALNGSIATGWIRAGGTTTDAQTWSIGPLAVTMPVFDAGRRAANEDAATARYEEAVVLYEARVRQAVREVEEALVILEAARARSEDARIAVDGYRQSFEATEARYRGGLASLIELEDQRRVYLVAVLTQVNLQRERLASWIALYRALGGGWTRPETVSSTR